MRHILFIAVLCFISSLSFGQNYKYEKNISYRDKPADSYQTEMCKVDVAYPESVQNSPVVVWFHGGGLTGGRREVPKELLRNNMIVVGVEYRLSPKVSTDEIIDDAAAAIAWSFDNAAKYGGSPAKIYIAGHSAGGYLASMVGLDRSRLAKYGKNADSIAGIIPFSGQAITHYETRNKMGMSPLEPLIDKSAPLYHIRKDAAPILIISGDRELELYGRYEENAYFWRMLKLTGHPDVTLYELDGFDHGGMCAPAFPLAVEFIRKHDKVQK